MHMLTKPVVEPDIVDTKCNDHYDHSDKQKQHDPDFGIVSRQIALLIEIQQFRSCRDDTQHDVASDVHAAFLFPSGQTSQADIAQDRNKRYPVFLHSRLLRDEKDPKADQNMPRQLSYHLRQCFDNILHCQMQ